MNRLKAFPIWIAVIICFTAIQNAVPQNIDRLPVLFENGQRSGISGFYRGELVYVSLEEFADLLSLRFFNSPKNKKLVLRAGSKGVKVTALNLFTERFMCLWLFSLKWLEASFLATWCGKEILIVCVFTGTGPISLALRLKNLKMDRLYALSPENRLRCLM